MTLSSALKEAIMAAKELESGDDDFLKERREGLESINSDIAAAAFATDMAELESDDINLIKDAEEERVKSTEGLFKLEVHFSVQLLLQH